jgi:glycosyltransferase involved in cell wall biosynthesis
MPWRFAADHLTAQSCEKIVCVSESVKKFHRARCSLPLSRYEVIPNGLDLKWLSDRPSREAARSALGIPADSWVVGTVARLEPEKNLPMLIDAFELTARNVKGVQLVIAGGGRLERALQERINRSPVEQCVRLLGYQADIRPVLAALDVFALASDWEGFGLATAEAMACGLPVIVTNVPGSRDLVGENLRGWLTPVGDAEAMAIRLEKAFFDSRSTHNRACAASEFAHRELGLDAMVDRYLQVYSQVSGVA